MLFVGRPRVRGTSTILRIIKNTEWDRCYRKEAFQQLRSYHVSVSFLSLSRIHTLSPISLARGLVRARQAVGRRRPAPPPTAPRALLADSLLADCATLGSNVRWLVGKGKKEEKNNKIKPEPPSPTKAGRRHSWAAPILAIIFCSTVPPHVFGSELNVK